VLSILIWFLPKLLNSQLGIVNFEPLKPLFMQLLMGSRATFSAFPSVPPLFVSFQRNPSDPPAKALPYLSNSLGELTKYVALE